MAALEAQKHSGSFEGLLFEGNTKDKSWTLVCPKHVTMTIRPPGGVARGGAWSLVASQKEEKVWEGGVEPGLKHRVKDNFVQWQHKSSSDGAAATFGLRMKTAELAQQFNVALGDAVSAAGIKPLPHRRLANDTVELKIVTPHGEPLPLPLPPTTTISQVMAVVAERRKLDPAHYNLTLPAEDPKGEGVACFGSMQVSRLKTHTLYLRRQPGAPEEARLNSGDQGIIQIELPRGERTSVKASGDISLQELLLMVCRKRNLEMGGLRFDLPATEGSLAGKTLGQLKLTSLRIVPRAESVIDQQISSQDTDSPKGGNRRHAPPPPAGPPQPKKVMREISAEMTEKKTTPTNYQLEKVDQKPLPPPVALKPKRKSVEEEEEEGGGGGGGGGKEETDGSPSISRSDLDSMVLGVKVREAAERPEMVTITEGLKMAAASGGRYLSVKRRRQQSMEEPSGSTHQTPPINHRRSREMEDIDIGVRHSPSHLTHRATRSLRRQPRGPAPTLPTGREQRAATLNRLTLQSAKETRKPSRKAPVRPAPTKPPEPPRSKATPTDKPADGMLTRQEGEKAVKREVVREKKAMEAEREEIDFSGYEFHPLTPPKSHSPPPQTPPLQTPPTTPSTVSPQPSPDDAVTATVVPQEGGGKTLIIKPSPSSSRKAKIVFNLPPPPPPPELPSTAGETPDNDGTAETPDKDAVEHEKQENGSFTPTDTPDISVTMATEIQPANELSVISNEYTNLDEEEEEEEELDSEPQPNTAVSPVIEENGGHGELQQEEENECGGKGVSEGVRDEMGEGVRDEMGEGVRDEMGEGVTGDGQKMLDMNQTTGKEEDTPDELIAALNCNGNNNNNNTDCFPPPPLEFGAPSDPPLEFGAPSDPPLEFVAPSDKFSTPAPQEAFLMPAEPSFGDESVIADNDDEAVVLVAMTTHGEDDSGKVGGVCEGVRGDKVMSESESTSSLGTQLVMVDSLISSMQELSEEVSSEASIPTPTPPPSPPPPPLAPPPLKRSPVPPKPAPPVTVPSPRKPQPPKPGTRSDPASSSMQPATDTSDPATSSIQPATDTRSDPATSSTDTRSDPATSSMQPATDTRSDPATISIQPATDRRVASSPSNNLLQQVPGPQSILQSGNLPGGEVQLQLQLLQQQLLQQQMMQLQTQFHQLQQSLQHPATAMAMIPPTMYPHPAMVAMSMAGMPGMGQSVAMPTIPAPQTMGQSISPVTYSPPRPLTSTPTSHNKPHPHNNAPERPRPQSDVIVQEKPQESDARPPSDDVANQTNDVTTQLRAGALGQLEAQFDRLMEDVRDTEQATLLRKVPLEPVAGGEGSYSGMAAVLAEALRERRKHFTADNRNASSLEMEDSRLSEWDS